MVSLSFYVEVCFILELTVNLIKQYYTLNHHLQKIGTKELFQDFFFSPPLSPTC